MNSPQARSLLSESRRNTRADASEYALSCAEIGKRLRVARESAIATQAEAAEIIGAARTTIAAIEKGRRRARIAEVQKLAAAYGTSANAILRREAVHLNLVPKFRALVSGHDDALVNAGRLLKQLVSAEIELENVLGIQRVRRYPPARPIQPGDIRDVRSQAEADAQALREWLGLGQGYIGDIFSMLDLQLGIRVYLSSFDSKIYGLYAFDDDAGACMLFNSIHPHTRLNMTAAHEFGHFMSARTEPGAITDRSRFTSRNERYAKSFANGFLTPAHSVHQRFLDITDGHSHLTRLHVIPLAHSFGVAREAMVRRLEELRLARKGTWDWFQNNGGITDTQARDVLSDRSPTHPPSLDSEIHLPPRLALLAGEAWKRGIFSEGQLARLLQLDRSGLRSLLDKMVTNEDEVDDFVQLAR